MTGKHQSGFLSNLARQRHRLRVKLFLLVMLFVLIAEAVVFIPSVAKFRRDWLDERIERAYLVSLSLEVAQQDAISDDRLKEIFMTAKIRGVSKVTPSSSYLILAPDLPIAHKLPFMEIDLREQSWRTLIRDALSNMVSADNAFLLVRDTPQGTQDVTLELFIEKAPLRAALWEYALGILLLSLIICLIAAGGVYFALNRLFVRPMERLTASVAAFERAPKDPANLIIPSDRRDEFGEAERALAKMQREVRAALDQKARLVTLGEGVSKINHDLRNILSSAVLISDRLARSDDPRVQKLSPRLVTALDKAVALCRATLDYGNVAAPKKQPVNLFDLVAEIEDVVSAVAGDRPLSVINEMPGDLEIMADRTQLFRALSNLARNAAEAMIGSETAQPTLRIGSDTGDGVVDILVTDNGPGVPDAAQADLFTPFKGSVRQGGSGLGLAISAEIARAHGGDLSLKQTGADGTVFALRLPQ